MFDKLVESTSTGAELGPRRRIFAATLVLVTTLFAAGIVASIYAADFDLGTDSFDIAELLSPIAEAEPKPEPEQPRPNSQAATSHRQSRLINQQRIDELPTTIPPISTQRNTYASRPEGEFKIGRRDTYGPPAEPTSNGLPPGDGNGSLRTTFDDTDPTVRQPPPPVKAPERKPPTPSLGVITGKASYLPRPNYPPAAKAVGASGAVNVQVTIDEQGNVISAKAVGGHILLRNVSEEAARRAKFSPTTLSKVPVKVTGVIVYNFTK